LAKLRFGIELPQHLGFTRLKEFAQTAEHLGYDSIWIRDHLIINPEEMARFPQGYIEDGERKVSNNYLSCIPTISAVAAVTRRITIGTDILNFPRRNPVDIANEAAAIDQISGGRFILQGAIGQPTRDWDPIGNKTPLKDRGKMLEEEIEIMKALWTHEEPISYKGKYYDIVNARIGSRPVQRPHPPIWLGVGKTFKRVAKYASGFTLTHSMFGGSLEEYRDSVEKIRNEATRFGRNPDEIEASARFALAVGSDQDATKKRAVKHWTKLWMESASWYGDWAGNPETVANVIRPYIDAGARHILVWPIPYGSRAECFQDIEIFAKEVIPLLRG
jgi:alkanesulfonate monooxygenase SsuD/methylene tetrahydromethanopterin reductase-like flavin-dependent oxidoreductase (luciferase family)